MQSNSKNKKIIFVCSWNLSRSPMAECIFKDMLKKYKIESKFSVTSAGVAATNGNLAAKNAIEAMHRKKLDLTKFRSKNLTSNMVFGSHLILTMENSHKQIILDQFPQSKNKVFTLSEYSSNSNLDIGDPYMQDLHHYVDCANKIEQKLIPILDRLIQENTQSDK